MFGLDQIHPVSVQLSKAGILRGLGSSWVRGLTLLVAVLEFGHISVQGVCMGPHESEVSSPTPPHSALSANLV